MSYYDNSQWLGSRQSSWEHPRTTTPNRMPASVNAPQPGDGFAFSYQFDEVDRAYENLQKSGKGFGVNGRHARIQHSAGQRSNHVNTFDEPRSVLGSGLQTYYSSHRHQPIKGASEAEQVMQAKRRMAAQRERELRNLHTEQQYQRNILSEVTLQGNRHMSEEETRELIARQRSALYGEGPFADRTTYVDESGNIRAAVPGPSGPSSLRGMSPMTFDGVGHPIGGPDTQIMSANENARAQNDPSPRPQSTISPQYVGPASKAFEAAVNHQNRTSTSSPAGETSPRELSASKLGQMGSTVAPIGTRPTASSTVASTSKGSSTPVATSSSWNHGSHVWSQASGLGTQARVWG